MTLIFPYHILYQVFDYLDVDTIIQILHFNNHGNYLLQRVISNYATTNNEPNILELLYYDPYLQHNLFQISKSAIDTACDNNPWADDKLRHKWFYQDPHDGYKKEAHFIHGMVRDMVKTMLIIKRLNASTDFRSLGSVILSSFRIKFPLSSIIPYRYASVFLNGVIIIRINL